MTPTTRRSPSARGGVLIVGAGEAGVRVATALREFGDDRPIVLLGDEPHLPYQRPPLSKAFLDGKADKDDLALRRPDFFQEYDIQLCAGRRVTHVDFDSVGAGSAICDDGGSIGFAQLVLATGAKARNLSVAGAALRGVHTLRGLDDADALRQSLGAAKQVVIIGAGYIGLEAAAVTGARGLPTTVVERERRLLSRISAEPLSQFLEGQHRKWGVEFALGADVRSLVGNAGQVQGVRLADGRLLPADLVIVGIGARPETALAEKLGLDVRHGIVVDAACRTRHSAVWAVGDCAVQPHPHVPGELIGVESVQNANDQARLAAASIAGVELPRAPVPWFWSDQGDLKLQIAGIADGYDHYAVRGAMTSSEVTVLYYREGALIAAESVNRPRDFLAAKRALGSGRTIDPDLAIDPAIPLKELITDRQRR